MHLIVLATDFDGTLAHDGVVDEDTISALERFRASGRRLVLVTGRHLADLCQIFPQLDLFDRVVVENGGVLYRPETHEEKLLSDPPDEHFIRLLEKAKAPFAVGRTVVATWKPHEAAVLSAIRELGLDLQVIFNKGSVMVLPSGVNKGTGLQAALDELGVSSHNVEIARKAGAPVAWLPLDAAWATLHTIGLTADAPHPNAGRLFLDFITSRAGQEIFREANYIPMHPDVPAKDPAMKAEQGGYKAIVLSPEEVDTNAQRYQKIYQEIFR